MSHDPIRTTLPNPAPRASPGAGAKNAAGVAHTRSASTVPRLGRNSGRNRALSAANTSRPSQSASAAPSEPRTLPRPKLPLFSPPLPAPPPLPPRSMASNASTASSHRRDTSRADGRSRGFGFIISRTRRTSGGENRCDGSGAHEFVLMRWNTA